MKKILLALVALVCVSTLSAQDYKNSIGLRLGYGAELHRAASLRHHLPADSRNVVGCHSVFGGQLHSHLCL